VKKTDRNKQINKISRKEFFLSILPALKFAVPILILVIGVASFLLFDEPMYTGKNIEGVVIELKKSTQGYRQINLTDVAKIRLDNGYTVYYEKADLRVGDKILYGIYKGEYTGREIYKPRPSSGFTPITDH
jgi:CRISPR/Cas system-associated exonuclease Cas4 (RecB family)